MYRRAFFISAFPMLACLLLSCGGDEEQRPPDTAKKDTAVEAPRPAYPALRPGLRYAVELYKKNFTPYDDAIARIGPHMYYCSYKGKVSRADTSGKDRAPLFNMNVEFLVDKCYLLPHDGDYLVFWQETDHLGVKSYAGRFKSGSEKPEWKITFKAPNVGQPTIDGNTGYVTAAGTLARVDLQSGAIEWKCDTLFNKYTTAFYKFAPARVYDSTVVFTEIPTGNRKRSDSVRVHVRTGELVR